MANTKIRRYLATGFIYLALVAAVFGFNVIRARTASPATQPAPVVKDSDRLGHQTLLFADDESLLLAKRIGAAVGQLPKHRLSGFSRLSHQRPQQVFQAAR